MYIPAHTQCISRSGAHDLRISAPGCTCTESPVNKELACLEALCSTNQVNVFVDAELARCGTSAFSGGALHYYLRLIYQDLTVRMVAHNIESGSCSFKHAYQYNHLFLHILLVTYHQSQDILAISDRHQNFKFYKPAADDANQHVAVW